MQFDLKKQLEIIGINIEDFNIVVHITSITTTDPEIIEIEYKTLFNEVSYIKHKIIIEVSGRSMTEPVEAVFLKSMIDEAYNETDFSEPSFVVNAVMPERTFIEKICLLHEEFAKPSDLIRKDRMSRHLYDLAQMSDSYVVSKALKNTELFNSIIEHRRVFIGLNGFDYDSLIPKNINIVPPSKIINQWEVDYRNMQETMIYGNSPPFDKLIEIIIKLNKEINQII